MKSVIQGFYNTPPLWKDQQLGLQQFKFPNLDLNVLGEFELPTNLRLGHQIEHVFKHLVLSSKDYDVIFNNILVEGNKKRIGELDFVLKDLKSKKHVHVELAYKFYIINPDISEPIYRLMGPNKRDMFYTKIDKLKEKQLPLLHHKSLSPYWETLKINPLKIEQQCCFKAQLFEPLGERVSIRPLNRDCVAGAWIRFDDLNTKEFNKALFYIPKKLEWTINPHNDVKWMGHFEALMEINLRMVKENAPMVWVKKSTGGLEKLFVVWW